MMSDVFRTELLNVVNKFNQNRFDLDDSYYFVRFSSDYVYLDRCTNGRIELFSRLTYNRKTSKLLIETLNNENDKFIEYLCNTSSENSLEKPLNNVMQFGMKRDRTYAEQNVFSTIK